MSNSSQTRDRSDGYFSQCLLLFFVNLKLLQCWNILILEPFARYFLFLWFFCKQQDSYSHREDDPKSWVNFSFISHTRKIAPNRSVIISSRWEQESRCLYLCFWFLQTVNLIICLAINSCYSGLIVCLNSFFRLHILHMELTTTAIKCPSLLLKQLPMVLILQHTLHRYCV
jgi:hypothetical protein